MHETSFNFEVKKKKTYKEVDVFIIITWKQIKNSVLFVFRCQKQDAEQYATLAYLLYVNTGDFLLSDNYAHCQRISKHTQKKSKKISIK